MDIDDIQIPSREVELPGFPDGTTLTVRGLSFKDFEVLYSAFSAEIETLFSTFFAAKADADILDAVVKALLTDFPIFTSHIIACANDRTDAAEKISMFPIAAQASLLIVIVELTVHSAATVKKIVDSIGAAIEATNGKQRPKS